MTTLEDAEEVFKELDVSEYDLRILDPDLPPASSSVFLPKQRCTMLSLNSLSLIISEKYSIYIDNNDNANVVIEETARRLRERITYGSHNVMRDEVFVLDTILDIFLTSQITNASYWENEASPIVEKIERGVSDDSLQKLKMIKARLNRMISDTDTVKETLGRALADDSAERVRVTLEIYYMSFNVQTLKIKDCLEEISNAEHTNNIRVDAQRNQILKFELVTLVFTLGLTVISAVSGIFGESLPLVNLNDSYHEFSLCHRLPLGQQCVFNTITVSQVKT